MQKSLADIAHASAVDEITDFRVYRRLANMKFNSKFAATLRRLAGMEYGHYRFWKRYCPDRQPKTSSLKVAFIVILRLLFGVTFAVKYLERGEAKTIRTYKEVARIIPRNDRKAFDRMLRDEEEHEKEFENQFQEPHVKYISFIVLGLADALVEIAGIHAGTLGLYEVTELAGLAGVVAGAAASIAMASAAYAQAKAGFKGSAAISAVYTGITYFVTVVFLAVPYFLTKSMLSALLTSLLLGILLLAFVTFYGSVISGSRFTKDFLELTGVMFGATVALYILGTTIRYLTGITI